MKKNWRYVAIGAACLAIGAAGTAGAAKLITSADIKDGSIEVKDLSKKAKKALKGKAGPAGVQGPKGDPGISGSPGGPGSSGSSGPSLMVGTMSAETSAERFASPAGGATFVSEGGAKVPVPPGASLIARDFIASLPAAPGVGKSVTLTLMLNSAPTALSCQIAGTATSCEAPGVTLPLPSGGQMAMRSTGSAGLVGTTVGWAFRVVF